MIQMMLTLKLVGMAFEKNSAATASEDDPWGAKSKAFDNIQFLDVIHYGFTYVGLLTGNHTRFAYADRGQNQYRFWIHSRVDSDSQNE